MWLYVACTEGDGVKSFVLLEHPVANDVDAFPQISYLEGTTHFRKINLSKAFRSEWLPSVISDLRNPQNDDLVKLVLGIGMNLMKPAE